MPRGPVPPLVHGELKAVTRPKESAITIILVFAILAVAFCGYYISQAGRDGGGDTTPPTNIDRSMPADDVIGTVSPPPPGWTALDDEQLTRLLREWSP